MLKVLYKVLLFKEDEMLLEVGHDRYIVFEVLLGLDLFLLALEGSESVEDSRPYERVDVVLES